MKTILVPVDFSAVTPAVIRAAVDLAALRGDKLLLLHTPVLPVVYEPYGLGMSTILDASFAVEEAGKKQLRSWAARLSGRGLSVGWELKEGRPASAIVAEAVARRARCIVIGSHGHGAMYDLFVGSTTQEVLRRAPCPVVVVPASRTARPAKKTPARAAAAGARAKE